MEYNLQEYWVTILYTWNSHNIVKQPFFNLKRKRVIHVRYLTHVTVAQLCPTLRGPRDYTARGVPQGRILGWAALPLSRGSPQARDWTREFYVSRTGRRVLSRSAHPGRPARTRGGLRAPSQFLQRLRQCVMAAAAVSGRSGAPPGGFQLSTMDAPAAPHVRPVSVPPCAWAVLSAPSLAASQFLIWCSWPALSVACNQRTLIDKLPKRGALMGSTVTGLYWGLQLGRIGGCINVDIIA